MKTHTKFLISIVLAFSSITTYSQVYQFKGGNWFINGKFTKTTFYTVNGYFTKEVPQTIDSVIDLQNKYCIPPFGDAHTHNLTDRYSIEAMANTYKKEGIFYVQVLGNPSNSAKMSREYLQKNQIVETVFANGFLTATYGHGFYPYEPLALGIYSPREQIKKQNVIKKSRIMENDAYFFLDKIEDVDNKWSLIMKSKPDLLKICLMDVKDYENLRKAEKVETYGVSAEVAEYILIKAHKNNLRVFAHIETAEDARFCAKIGVDGLAHLPGYGWNGKDETKLKYCMTTTDAKLFKKAKMTITPTLNLDYTVEFDSSGKMTTFPERFEKTLKYEKKMMNTLYKLGVNIALGADDYGKTVSKEIDYLVKYDFFKEKQLIDIYCRQTPQSIFPNRKIGEIKEGYEASFLVLNENPMKNIETIKKIEGRIKKGRIINLP
jgi:imidazolonepropionase-like amidohydrolase